MKVILREEVESLGNAGDLVTVKDGYANNYLLPRSLAVRADGRNVKQLEHAKRSMLARRSRLEEAAKDRAGTINGIGRVVFTKTCGLEGKLFGAVTSRDIAGQLLERGVEVNRRRIELHEPIKKLGDYDIKLKLGQGVEVEIKVSVEPDESSAALIADAAAHQASQAAESAAEESADDSDKGYREQY